MQTLKLFISLIIFEFSKKYDYLIMRKEGDFKPKGHSKTLISTSIRCVYVNYRFLKVIKYNPKNNCRNSLIT